MQGSLGIAGWQNLPLHGGIQRHTQDWSNVSICRAHRRRRNSLHKFATQTSNLSASCFSHIVTVKSIPFSQRLIEHSMSKCNTPHCLVSLRYQYVIGENTWVEYWPTDEECQTDTFRDTCIGISEMEQQYFYFGCPQKWKDTVFWYEKTNHCTKCTKLSVNENMCFIYVCVCLYVFF